MVRIKIDASDLKKLMREIDRIRAKLPQGIARGINEGGDKVRTQVRAALRRQTSLVRLNSVTSRERVARAFAGQADATAVAQGSAVGQGMQYQIIYTSKRTRIGEFRFVARTGPGGGVTAVMWGVPHKFARSFRIKGTAGLRGLRARTSAKHEPTRAFDGPNLAKEAVKGETAKAFFETVETAVVPAVEKQILKTLARK